MPELTEQTSDKATDWPEVSEPKPARRRFGIWLVAALFIFGAAALAYVMLGSPVGSKNNQNENTGKTQGLQARTVTAEVRPITSVLVFDAVVVANPMFRLPASVDGTVTEMAGGRVGIRGANDTTAQPIVMPPSSEIVELLVQPGTTVTAGLPIINARYVGFAMQASVAPEKVYRIYTGIISAKGDITNGPGPFDGSVLGMPFVPGNGGYAESPEASVPTDSSPTVGQDAATAPNAQLASKTASGQPEPIHVNDAWSTSAANAAEGLVVVVTIPTDLKILEGLPGLLALKVAEVTDAVALPVEAVAGISQRGQVYVENGGKRELRDVVLGITDGSYIQISSGISAGEKVFLSSPSISNLK